MKYPLLAALALTVLSMGSCKNQKRRLRLKAMPTLWR